MPKEYGTPAASDPVEESPVASVAADPTADESGSTPAAEQHDPSEQALRNLKAQHGRELQRARQQAEQAQQLAVQQAAQLAALNDQISQIGSYLTTQETQRRDAYLASLPEPQRAKEEMRLLKQEVAALRARPPAQQQAQQAQPSSAEQETLRRAGGMLEALNDAHDLGDDDALDLRDPGLDWSSEEAFRQSAKALARERAGGSAEQPVAGKKVDPKQQHVPVDREALKRDLKKELLAELGVGGSNTAKAVGSGDGAPSVAEGVLKIQTGYKAKGGMARHLKELQELRDQAKQAV